LSYLSVWINQHVLFFSNNITENNVKSYSGLGKGLKEEKCIFLDKIFSDSSYTYNYV